MSGDLHERGLAPRALTWGAVHRILTGGNHHPLLCQLEDDRGPAGLWVVKPPWCVGGDNGREHLAVVSEIAASHVCAWLGVSTPAIGLVAFPSELATDLYAHLPEDERTEVAEIFKLNRGKHAFCCRFLEGAVDLLAAEIGKQRNRAALLGTGVLLYALDAYVRHDDRTGENPNTLWWAEQIVAIDHGACFTGMSRRGATGAALAAQTALAPQTLRRHVLYDPLIEVLDAVDFQPFKDAVAAITDAEIDAVALPLPRELALPLHDAGDSGVLSEMIAFLKERRAYAHELAETLRRSLEPSK